MVPMPEEISMGTLTCGQKTRGGSRVLAKRGLHHPARCCVWAQPSPRPLGHIKPSGLFLKKVLRTGKAPQAFPGLEVDVTSLGTGPEGPAASWTVKSLPPRGQCAGGSVGTPGPQLLPVGPRDRAGRWSERKR